MAVAEDKLRPVVPEDLHPSLQDLLRACFEPEPEQRPSFAMIVQHLGRLVPELAALEAGTGGGGANVFGRFFNKAAAAVQ